MTSTARRPRVIRHMVVAVDRRVVVDGRPDAAGAPPHRLALDAVERRDDDIVWLRDRVAGRRA